MKYLDFFRLISLVVCCFLSLSLWAQHPSAIAEYESTEKGILIPRMTEAQRLAIASPAAALLVYETDSQTFWFFNGTTWINLTVNPADNLGNHTASQELDLSAFKIKNLADPDSAQDAATKNYVDNNDAVDDGDSDPANELQNLTQVLTQGNDAGAARISNLANPDSAQDAATKNYVDNKLGTLQLDRIRDADNDTRILVEKNSDEDSIRFEIAGSDFAIMDGKTLHLLAPDSSLFIGWNAGRDDDGTDNRNTFLGHRAGQANTTGNKNVMAGYFAGGHNTSGILNSFFGHGAGFSNTTGKENSFFGERAGAANTTGNENSFFGQFAGFKNTEGFRNSFFGKGAGHNNTTGSENSFVGFDAGLFNDTASFNSFFGIEAGRSNTGSENTIVGYSAGRNNSTGFRNSFFGGLAGTRNTTGTRNTFIGYDAEQLVLGDPLDRAVAIGHNAKVNCSNCAVIGGTGIDAVKVGIGTTTPEESLHVEGHTRIRGNIDIHHPADSTSLFIGRNAGVNTTFSAPRANTFVGSEAGHSNTIGEHNSFFGSQSGMKNSEGFQNSFFGYKSGLENTSAFQNSFFGSNAGRQNTTGFLNSFFGCFAGALNTSGGSNTFLGFGAGEHNTTGEKNVCIGRGAGVFGDSTNNNVMAGFEAGRDNQADGNTFVGFQSGRTNTTGTRNAFFGYDAGRQNTDGNDNSFFGRDAGRENTEGGSNTFFGARSGRNNTSGDRNAFFGTSSGQLNNGSFNCFYGFAGSSNTSGSQNAFFGDGSGHDNTTGSLNAFFGPNSGNNNTTGRLNAFFGTGAGTNNHDGTRNTFIGSGAEQVTPGDSLDRAIAIGYNAQVDCHNCAVIGGTGSDAVKVGLGTTTPEYTLDVNGEMIVRDEAGIAFFQSTTANSFVRFQNTGDASGTSVGYFDDNSSEYFFVDLPGSPFGEFVVRSNGRVGINDITPDFLLDVNGTAGKPGGGSWSNASDARLKKEVAPYADGLDKILQINPITYHYNELSGIDTEPEYVGIIAQEMQQIAPYMVTQNLKVEGQEEEYLSFDGSALTYMLINGMKEQQVQIEEQQQMIGELQAEKEKWDRQQKEIEELRAMVLQLVKREE